MKLEYSRPVNAQGNFGDDLNEWIWDKIAPGLIDKDEGTVLLGIGTILERWFTDSLQAGCHKVVIGSGSGITGNLPQVNDSWSIYGVRGPLTAAFLGLPPGMILTDPAMLVRDFVHVQPRARRSKIGFMPHIATVDTWDWKQVCATIGLQYINPREEARGTLDVISHLEHIITEAMHGAIVADALRVPWTAVAIARDFREMKWHDWGGSLQLPVKIHRVPELYEERRSPMRVIGSKAKRRIKRLSGQSAELLRPSTSPWEVEEVVRTLRKLKDPLHRQLSDSAHLELAVSRTRSAIERALFDKQNGRFGPAA